jgi:RNA polymerase sigma-70 factor (ECF subfamily)
VSGTRPLRRHAQLRLTVDPDMSPAADSVIEVKSPDADSFASLYQRYSPYVAAIGERLLGRDELKGLVQDVFEQVLRGLDQLREPAAFKGWLAQITIRAATRRHRKRELRDAVLGSQERTQQELLTPQSATAEQRTLGAQMYKLLDTLPAKSRVIWILRHLQGEALHVIARRVGCSLSTVQHRLLDAQSALEALVMRDFAT